MTAHGGNAYSLVEAVSELIVDRRTGVLDVRADGVGTRIYFAAGKPVFAEDDAPGETFGRLLMRQGVITNAEFVRVIDAMTLAAKGGQPAALRRGCRRSRRLDVRAGGARSRRSGVRDHRSGACPG